MRIHSAVTLLMGEFVFQLSECATVCYNLVGGPTCFNNDPPFDNAFGFLPDSPENINTQFYLFTRDGGAERLDPTNLASSDNLRQRPTKILIHGYTGGAVFLLPLVRALLEQGDYNVILVNWRGGAARLNYFQSAADARLVGAQIGDLVNSLAATYGISPADVHLIGISLGAHVAGYAGQSVPGLGRITGLDPAGVAFRENDPRVRLSSGDAQYVDIIHTNGGAYGLFQPTGDADFYINGGRRQPGCVTNLCSHLRSLTYLIATIRGGCSHVASPCQRTLRPLEPFSCQSPLLCRNPRDCPRAGFYSAQDGASGIYSISTTTRYPYCSTS